VVRIRNIKLAIFFRKRLYGSKVTLVELNFFKLRNVIVEQSIEIRT